MGVRFYRRIRICKGVHLNVSKSGVGISLGMRGASISTGPRGQYVNLGIPGTGIAYRQKIGSNTSNSSSQEKYLSDSDVRRRSYIENSHLKIQIDNDGKELVYMEAPDGTAFVDEEMMRRVKRSDMYREMLEITRKTKYDYMKQKNESCVEIYKAAPKLITEQDVIQERDNPTNIVKEEYKIHEFQEPEPILTPFYDKAHAWAVENVQAHFWNRKKKIHFAEHQKMYEMFEEAKTDWAKRRDEYYENERKTKEIKDKEFEEDYKRRAAEQAGIYEEILNPSDDYLIDTVKDVLSQIELPVDFSIDYAVNNCEIELDIDLPEIEDFPQKTCSILSSGKLSIKNKSIAELNKDYATGVTGMAFYFASVLYNISPKIDKISISGYTQRISKKTGNEEDQYVYSVVFTRDKFAELNIQNIDPIQAITNFDCTMDITSKYELKTIEVKESANRKTNVDDQENQTEYYTVESVSKEPETIVIEKELKTAPKSYSNSYESSYNPSNSTSNYTSYENNSTPEPKKNHGCLIALLIIIAFPFVFYFILESIHQATKDKTYTSYNRTSSSSTSYETYTPKSYELSEDEKKRSAYNIFYTENYPQIITHLKNPNNKKSGVSSREDATITVYHVATLSNATSYSDLALIAERVENEHPSKYVSVYIYDKNYGSKVKIYRSYPEGDLEVKKGCLAKKSYDDYSITTNPYK